MRVTIFGSGYVGLVTGACLAPVIGEHLPTRLHRQVAKRPI